MPPGVLDLPPEIFGRPKAEGGKWASCVRILDPVNVSYTFGGATTLRSNRELFRARLFLI